MIYQLKGFTLDTDLFELSAGEELLHAEPQVIELLTLLIENRDRVVGKEEINEKVWRGRVVSDAALSSRIKTARQLLGDDGQTQGFIKTIHKKGFRFVGEITQPDINDVEARSSTQPSESTGAEATATKSDSNTVANITKPAIAILPFANLSNDAEQEYFVDGITSDIITHLSKHRWLRVTARNTSFGFKGQRVDIGELSTQLDLDYVVEGTIQKAGNRVRINVLLIDSKSGHQLWSDRYDRELSDIFALQDEITEKIVARLEPEIGMAERGRVVLTRPADLKAWDCYHLGIYHFFKFTGEDNLLAQSFLKQSFSIDEHFGEAYSWWAYAVTLGMIYWDTEPTQEMLDEALNACNIALKIDSHNASFYALKARVLLARKEYDVAILENEKAISLNPTFAAAHCGLGDSLAYEGNYADSIACFERAIELSPNDPQIWAFYSYAALAMIFMQDYERAAQWTEKAISIPNCQFWANAHQVVAYAFLDRPQELQRAKRKLIAKRPNFSIEFVREKLFYLKREEQIELYVSGLRKAGF